MASTACSRMLQPLLLTWKSRLPLVALPVLLGLRRLAPHALLTPGAFESAAFEVCLLAAIALGTGLFHLPFSVTWWFVLIAAYSLEGSLLLGAAVILSLTVLLGWYGSLLRYPHAISALWTCGGESTAGAKVPLSIWQMWDLAVHATPAVLVLLWHGPHLEGGAVKPGAVTPAALAVSLPLNLLWLAGVKIGAGQSPLSAKLHETNMVYKIAPLLPERCWLWIYGSHWATCAVWFTFLAFDFGVAKFLAALPMLWGWHLLAKSHLREDLLVGRATFFLVVHVLALWGACRACMHESALRLWVEVVLMWQIGGFGITVGVHRLWSHRSYNAKLPFRVMLMLLNSFANQGTIYHWARDHRAHHKFTDTPADPHDTTRGFFYAHMGWLLVPKTKELKVKGDSLPCADLLADPVVAFQMWAERRFFFMELMSFGLPAVYGHFKYQDALLGFLVHGMLRWIVCLHATWCVNSVAHYFGDRIYDPKASARESFLTSILADGEGWHSFHHKYPYDYAASELGVSSQWNPSKLFIDVAAFFGQVSNRKKATVKL